MIRSDCGGDCWRWWQKQDCCKSQRGHGCRKQDKLCKKQMTTAWFALGNDRNNCWLMWMFWKWCCSGVDVLRNCEQTTKERCIMIVASSCMRCIFRFLTSLAACVSKVLTWFCESLDTVLPIYICSTFMVWDQFRFVFEKLSSWSTSYSGLLLRGTIKRLLQAELLPYNR